MSCGVRQVTGPSSGSPSRRFRCMSKPVMELKVVWHTEQWQAASPVHVVLHPIQEMAYLGFLACVTPGDYPTIPVGTLVLSVWVARVAASVIDVGRVYWSASSVAADDLSSRSAHPLAVSTSL